MKTLAKYFADLRAAADLSYSEVAAKCGGLSRHVVWKLENGKPIKAVTLGVILNKGLGIPKDSKTYAEAFALWSAGMAHTNTGPDVTATLGRLKLGSDKQFQAFAASVVDLLRDVPASDRPKVLEALGAIPALKLWLLSRK